MRSVTHACAGRKPGRQAESRKRRRAMIIDCAHYADGKRQSEEALSIEEASRCAVGEGSFVWLGLREPSDEELQAAAKAFGLHELAVEDAGRAHQRPKLE